MILIIRVPARNPVDFHAKIAGKTAPLNSLCASAPLHSLREPCSIQQLLILPSIQQPFLYAESRSFRQQY